MKKLGKKFVSTNATVEAYCYCTCSCSCSGCSCYCFEQQVSSGTYNSISSVDPTYQSDASSSQQSQNRLYGTIWG